MALLTDDDRKWYRYLHFEASGLFDNRVQLQRAQQLQGFPRSIRISRNRAVFPVSEVDHWVRKHMLRSKGDQAA